MANISGLDAPVLGDTDYVDKIEDSLNAIDAHDHSATKGLQIANGGIADSAITNVKVSATADVAASKINAGTNNRAIVSNASTGRLEVSAVTGTELALLSGVTSLTDPNVGVITLTEQAATQSTPASGKSKLYSKVDNALYFLDDNGVETAIGGGTSGGSASNLEALQNSNKQAAVGFPTPLMDNSVRANGLEIPAHTYFVGNLIENYTSGGSTAKVVWNPVVANSADSDYDSIALWSAIGAGTTLAATAGSTKVGANHFSFNKDGSAVDASIRLTLAAQTLSVGANYRVYFWVDMPSVTNLSSIYLKIMGAATTDFSRWNLTTNSAGGALATGYNLMFVDIANTAASSTGGTPPSYTSLLRYIEVGITTSSAGQTYTGIKFAGLWFSHGDIAAWGPEGLEFTVADTSNKNDFKIDYSSTTKDGIVTLAASVAQNYTAGVAAAARAIWYRSSMSWSQAGLIGFNTGLTSGTIATEEEIRLTKVLRESLSGNYGAYVDMFTPQIYKVTVVGGSTIGVADSENHSANLLNADSIHIFKTVYSAGEPNFYLLATRAMTAGSSHSSGTTTLTVDPTGIAVGDYVVKQHLTVSSSVVSATANENFSTMSYDTSPNSSQLLGSRSYPNPNNVYAHWWLGGPSETLALKDQTGNNRGLTKLGSPNLSSDFKSGKYSATSFTSTTNYLRTSADNFLNFDAVGELIQISFWLYIDGADTGDNRHIFGCRSYHGGSDYRGWVLFNPISTTSLRLETYNSAGSGTSLTPALTNGTWNHVVVQLQSAIYQRLYVNGVLSSVSAGTISGAGATGQAFYVGSVSESTSIDSSMTVGSLRNLKIADCIVWRDGSLLTQTDVNYLYNGGVPQFIGYNPAVLRNEYKVTGASGQRISMKAKLNRTTTAVSPYVLDAGLVKIG